MRDRSGKRVVMGFTLLEMLVVLVIIGMLVGLVGPRLFSKVDSSKVQTAETQIKLLRGAIETIKENPYVILKHYEDLGYDIHFCDKIAMKFGYKSNHPNRLEYGVIHGLNIASQDGHVYIPKDEFIELLEA